MLKWPFFKRWLIFLGWALGISLVVWLEGRPKFPFWETLRNWALALSVINLITYHLSPYYRPPRRQDE